MKGPGDRLLPGLFFDSYRRRDENSNTGINIMYSKLGSLLVVLAVNLIAGLAAAAIVVVDGVEISREQFETEVYNAGRQTFYHGRPTNDAQLIEYRRDVAEKMVDRILLLGEARRRNIQPNHDAIAARLAVYEDRYADSERWQSEGEQMIATLRTRLEEDSMLEILEQEVRFVADPGESVVRDYFEKHPEKFTEPEQIRVSVIMLSVAPSATGETWQAARTEGADLVERIRGGADFAELARMHSADSSARNGGDMGYLHIGMLSGSAQQAVDELDIGAVSEPIQVLEGIAVFRLTDRKEHSLQPYLAVSQRASDLWKREEGERLWDQTIAMLRTQSDISLDEEYLQALPAAQR